MSVRGCTLPESDAKIMSTYTRKIATLAATIVLAIAHFACVAEGSEDPKTAAITAEGLHQRLQSTDQPPLIVDVREPHEFTAVRIEGAKLAPLGTVVKDLEGVDKNREIVLVCRSGNRSGKAQKQLAERGYTNLRNMTGGMLAWEKRGYPVVKRGKLRK
jgi:rhodanese-related sulfurtransferase